MAHPDTSRCIVVHRGTSWYITVLHDEALPSAHRPVYVIAPRRRRPLAVQNSTDLDPRAIGPGRSALLRRHIRAVRIPRPLVGCAAPLGIAPSCRLVELSPCNAAGRASHGLGAMSAMWSAQTGRFDSQTRLHSADIKHTRTPVFARISMLSCLFWSFDSLEV